MNLEKLFKMQKALQERIGYNEPDRFDKLVLALLVEIGECANENRSWKFWSVNQLPHTSAVRVPCMMEEDKEYYDPQLEEYVDGFHFVLGIGLELQKTKDPYFPEFEDDVTQQFRSVYYHASLLNDSNYDTYDYLMSYYLGLGEMLGYSWEQIEQAYFDKYKINIQRQESGVY